MNQASSENFSQHRFTVQIIIAMFIGLFVGLALRWIPIDAGIKSFIVEKIFATGGQLFFNLIKMMVVPIVFVSLVLGCGSLKNIRQFGRIGGKTFVLYIFTTALAITLALLIASTFHIGEGLNIPGKHAYHQPTPPSIQQVIIGIVPTNPFAALVNGHMLQVIFFSLFFGIVITMTGQYGKSVNKGFAAVNEILIKMILLVIRIAPYGVFFLLAELFAKIGFELIQHLIGYFMVVLLVLFVQLILVYGVLLTLLGRLSPLPFFRKMYATMLFAFSISSSNASIPVVLRNVRQRLGVDNTVASFVIPLGATINMDGTAIMQGVATVFIANAFHVSLGFTGYLIVIAMATLASIGTAGVPSIGLITLAMVLQQVGLPVEGIGLIIGVDRLLDMTRTAVNISGDSMVACVVAKSEKSLNLSTYQGKV